MEIILSASVILIVTAISLLGRAAAKEILVIQNDVNPSKQTFSSAMTRVEFESVRTPCLSQFSLRVF